MSSFLRGTVEFRKSYFPTPFYLDWRQILHYPNFHFWKQAVEILLRSFKEDVLGQYFSETIK